MPADPQHLTISLYLRQNRFRLTSICCIEEDFQSSSNAKRFTPLFTGYCRDVQNNQIMMER